MIHLVRLYVSNFKQLQELELRFPERARVLVQGRNESGKSTLFEAVFFALFGQALATEAGARGLDDLIRYDLEKARVELDVCVRDRLLRITRTVVRGKSNIWELDVTRDDERQEIRGNAAVNRRLIAEMGFDADALLNTCFVEQKKLEKLEGLNKTKREESLARLLNLDALVAIEGDLKVRSEDKQELERLRLRSELADVQFELPAHEAKLTQVEQKLKLIELSKTVASAVGELRTADQLDAAVRDLSAKRAALGEQAEKIEALKEAMLSVKQALDAAERTAENGREVERLKVELSDARRSLETLPGLESRSNALERLARRTRRLDAIGAAQEASSSRAAQLATAQARLADLSASAAEQERVISRLDAQLHGYDVGQALGDWIAAQQEHAAQAEIQNSVQEKIIERDRAARRLRREMAGIGLVVLALAAAGAAALPITLALGYPFPVRLIVTIVFLLLAVVAAVVLVLRGLARWRDLARATQAVGEAQGQELARASASEAQQERLAKAVERLAQLELSLPETVDLAQSTRVSIARELNNQTREELTAGREVAREQWLNARAVLSELAQQSAVADVAQAGPERERCERAAAKAEAILGRWKPRAQAIARTLGTDMEEEAIRRARSRVDAEIAHVQGLAKGASHAGEQLARLDQQSRSLMDVAQKAFGAARDRGLTPAAPPWSPSLAVDDYTAFGKELRAAFDSLGGEAVVKQVRQVEGELGRRQGERETRARNAFALVARTQELLAGAGLTAALTLPVDLKQMEELRSRLQSLDLGAEPALSAEHRELVGRVHSLRDRQAQLERELGLENSLLDPAACRAEWKDKTRQLLVRERGIEIASLARRRIVQKVLPATMDYMRQILPAITRDRYHDAQLDPESYKIQVWDERAAAGGSVQGEEYFQRRDQGPVLAGAAARLRARHASARTRHFTLVHLSRRTPEFLRRRARRCADLLADRGRDRARVRSDLSDQSRPRRRTAVHPPRRAGERPRRGERPTRRVTRGRRPCRVSTRRWVKPSGRAARPVRARRDIRWSR